MIKLLDKYVTPWAPKWVIQLVVSVGFGLIMAVFPLTILAIATLDLTWYVGVTARALVSAISLLLFASLLVK